MKKIFAVLLGVCSSVYLLAQQTVISGVVKDANSGETLIGASVLYAPGKGVVTDFDGKFSLSLDNGDYTLTVSYVGMEAQERQIKAAGNTIYLEFALEFTAMNEVEIVGDIAIDRQTPVAYSDISSIKIKEELGTRDLPLVLNSTPGIYATQSGGGDGDSRVNIRGFNGRYVAVMVDGIPMNDMENGLVYWSNWFGLDVVTQKVQVQRGLGASKLAIPSIGGTINILSQGIEQKRNITFSSEYGNNQNLRETLGYNSGRLKGGWGVTAALSVKKNNGWVENLMSKQLFYFLKIQKDFKNQSLSVSILGSPQQHYQRPLRQQIAYYDKAFAAGQGIDTSLFAGGDYGIRHNQYWGRLIRNRGGERPEEELLSDRVNYYHKPIVNLKHFWTLGENLALSNIVYASFGNGGGTALQTSVFDSDGQTDFQHIYYNNTHGSIFVPPYDLAYVNDTSQYKSRNYILSRINNHFWTGILSTFKYKPNKRFEFSGGFDGRYYYTDRYQTIYDLLGGDYAVPSALGDDKNNPDDLVKREGDIFGYKIRTYVKQGGIFLLGEYKKDDWSGFINVTGSVNAYNRTDYFQLKNPDGEYKTSGWKTFPGGTIKAGVNYNLNKYHSVFANSGYLSRAQMAANVFVSTGLQVYAGLKNEEIIAEEIGYMYKRGIVRTAVNLYYTIWNNKPVKQSIAYGTDVYPVSIPGMNALHKGLELEAEIKTSEKLSADIALSVGDWRWTSDAEAVVTNESGTQIIDTIQFSARNVRVGDAAQFQGSLGIRYEPLKDFYIRPRVTYFDNNFSDFDPESLKGDNANRQSWKIPAYYQLDINLGYSHAIGQKKYRIGFKVNLINVTDVIYISDARNNEFGNGFNSASAGVYMGMGFRWNVGVNFNF